MNNTGQLFFASALLCVAVSCKHNPPKDDVDLKIEELLSKMTIEE